MIATIKTTLLATAVVLVACGKNKDKAEPEPAKTAAAPAAPAAPAVPPEAPAAAPEAPAADPYANGFCEWTVDGGEPQKGGGGIRNVMSIHWMAADQQGRSVAGPLLINCGPTGNQLNFSSDTDDVKREPKKHKVGKGAFVVMGKDFMSGEGELDITAWDDEHVAGSFSITAAGKKYTGNFDLQCPYPGNGICK